MCSTHPLEGAAVSEITYARAGEFPEDWHELEVIDLSSGLLMQDVVEVDTVMGWVLRYARDPRTGRYIVVTDEILREVVRGRFQIRRRASDEDTPDRSGPRAEHGSSETTVPVPSE